jgi:hypothetical protein
MNETPELACTSCHTQISDQFYTASDHPYCLKCKTHIFDQKLGCGGYLPAAGIGLVAAVLGAVLDFSVTAATDTQYGMIALIMGAMIGWGVRKGSRGRGGRLFQLMAVALTYLAISWSLSSLVVREMISPSEPVVAATPDARSPFLPDFSTPDAATPTPQATPTPEATPTPQATPEEAVPDPVVSETPNTDQTAEPLTGAGLAIGLVFVLAAGLALPIVVVFVDPINALLYALAMWQAGSMVKPVTLEGPHSLQELRNAAADGPASDQQAPNAFGE